MRIQVCLVLTTLFLCSSTFLQTSYKDRPIHVNLQAKLRTKLQALDNSGTDPDELFSCAEQQEEEVKEEVADVMEELAEEMEDTSVCEQKEKAVEIIKRQPPEVVTYILPLIDEPEISEEVIEEVPVPTKPYFRPEKQEIVQVVDDEIVKIPVAHNIPPCSAPPEKPYIPLPELDEQPPPPTPPQAERLVMEPMEAPCEMEDRERMEAILPDVVRMVDAWEESQEAGMEVFQEIESTMTVEEILEVLLHNGDKKVASELLANLAEDENPEAGQDQGETEEEGSGDGSDNEDETEGSGDDGSSSQDDSQEGQEQPNQEDVEEETGEEQAASDVAESQESGQEDGNEDSEQSPSDDSENTEESEAQENEEGVEGNEETEDSEAQGDQEDTTSEDQADDGTQDTETTEDAETEDQVDEETETNEAQDNAAQDNAETETNENQGDEETETSEAQDEQENAASGSQDESEQAESEQQDTADVTDEGSEAEQQVLEVTSSPKSEQTAAIVPATASTEEGESSMEDVGPPPANDNQIMEDIVSQTVSDQQTGPDGFSFIQKRLESAN